MVQRRGELSVRVTVGDAEPRRRSRDARGRGARGRARADGGEVGVGDLGAVPDRGTAAHLRLPGVDEWHGATRRDVEVAGARRRRIERQHVGVATTIRRLDRRGVAVVLNLGVSPRSADGPEVGQRRATVQRDAVPHSRHRRRRARVGALGGRDVAARSSGVGLGFLPVEPDAIGLHRCAGLQRDPSCIGGTHRHHALLAYERRVEDTCARCVQRAAVENLRVLVVGHSGRRHRCLIGAERDGAEAIDEQRRQRDGHRDQEGAEKDEGRPDEIGRAESARGRGARGG